MDTKQFSADYPEGWTDAEKGVFIETKKWGLVYYSEIDEDITLVERAKSEPECSYKRAT